MGGAIIIKQTYLLVIIKLVSFARFYFLFFLFFFDLLGNNPDVVFPGFLFFKLACSTAGQPVFLLQLVVVDKKPMTQMNIQHLIKRPNLSFIILFI